MLVLADRDIIIIILSLLFLASYRGIKNTVQVSLNILAAVSPNTN